MYSCVPDLLDDVRRQHAADLGRPLVGELPLQRRQEAGPERVAHAGRLDRHHTGDGGHLDLLLVVADDPHAVRPEGDHLRADAVEDLLRRPAGLRLDQVRLVLVGEQVRRSVDQLADHLALAEGQLLARVGDERVAALAALLGVADHALRVVGTDQHERRLPHALARSGRARSAGPRSSPPGRSWRTGPSSRRWCTRSGPCAGPRRSAPSRSRPRGAPATSGSRRSPHRRRPPAPGAGPAGRGRSRCCRRSRRAGSRGRPRGRRPTACRAARRPASRRTCRRSSSGGRWRWTRR